MATHAVSLHGGVTLHDRKSDGAPKAIAGQHAPTDEVFYGPNADAIPNGDDLLFDQERLRSCS
jgi:hypothetical protein